jgi:hypothetical protein
MSLGKSGQARWLAAALTVKQPRSRRAVGGGDEGDAAGTTARPSESVAGGEAEPILIKTLVNTPTGKILDGSTIGDSPAGCAPRRNSSIKGERGAPRGRVRPLGADHGCSNRGVPGS